MSDDAAASVVEAPPASGGENGSGGSSSDNNRNRNDLHSALTTIFTLLPVEIPRNVGFSNLVFEVRKKNTEPLRILKGITGGFKHSKLTAVMGSSGAGKTTLL